VSGLERQGALAAAFERLYGKRPRLFRAPGRVNLIGEHTDYNDGFVMPVAISRATWLAAAPRDDDRLRISSEDLKGDAEYDIGRITRRGHWSDYAAGVAATLLRRGIALGGADLLVKTEVPIGAGLSSSAALEIATGLALLGLAGRNDYPRLELAKAALEAEKEFAGMQCGIMDQFISAMGRRDHVLLLDCRSLIADPVPLPEKYELAICNTGVKHALAGSEYNQRRAECERGTELLREYYPEIRALRDVSESDFEKVAGALPEIIRRRCRHVITENGRVHATRRALAEGDMSAVRMLMAASHESLRRDYQVSCAELDSMVEIATHAPGFAGGRMTGGGFGGCTVNFVEAGRGDVFGAFVLKEYRRRWPDLNSDVYLVESADGASEEPIPPTI
jgi:galactokinase